MPSLETKIQYTFKNSALLEQALTHRSKSANNYERLEFLGDSILSMVIAQKIYHKYPKLDEGKLTRMRSSLVRGETLSELALEINLSEHIHLGLGELKGGGVNRPSILEDTMEAIFGAVFLDSDFDTVQKLILKIYEKRINDLSPEMNIKDPKTQLQEHLQKYKFSLPIYTLTNTQGKDHNAIFTVSCFLEDKKITIIQKSTSIKKAEQKCAQALLEKLLKI
jgi:ribonuclease-3